MRKPYLSHFSATYDARRYIQLLVTNSVWIPLVFWLSADKSLNFRLGSLKTFHSNPQSKSQTLKKQWWTQAFCRIMLSREQSVVFQQQNAKLFTWSQAWNEGSTSAEHFILLPRSNTFTFDGPQSCHEVVICHFSAVYYSFGEETFYTVW